MPVIPALGRLRQDDEFKSSLAYKVRQYPTHTQNPNCLVAHILHIVHSSPTFIPQLSMSLRAGGSESTLIRDMCSAVVVHNF